MSNHTESTSPLLLHSVSIVITAEHHDPMILSPSFLVDKKIVPADRKVVRSETALLESTVRYDEILWEMNPSRLAVAEGWDNPDNPFKDDYLLYKMVDAYLAEVSYTPYRSLGLNCTAYMRQDDPGQWLRQRFLHPGPWCEGESKVLAFTPNFVVDAGDGVLCNLSLESATVMPQGGSERAIVVNSNIHHPGPLNADEMRAAISRWPEGQDFVISVLDKFLRSPQV